MFPLNVYYIEIMFEICRVKKCTKNYVTMYLK